MGRKAKKKYLLQDKKILLVSPENWNHIHVSKHHYAINLAERGNTVFFLNPPSKKWSVQSTEFSNLFQVDYTGFWKGLHLLPKMIREVNQKRVFRTIERAAGINFDIIWSFDNSVFYDFDFLGREILGISHIVDLNQNFQMSRASSSADLCIGVIPQIVNRHLKENQNSFLVKHGVDVSISKNKAHLPGIQKKRALYFGNLEMPHLNWNLLDDLVAKLDNVDFLLVGPNHDKVPISNYPNLYLLEEVDSKTLFDYMEEVDVLFVFYTDEYYSSFASPHKMLEYLSSGKPVVSNFFDKHDEIASLIYQSDTLEDWINNFKRAFEERDPELRNQRLNYAMDNTYKKQIDRIEGILSDL